MLILDEVSVDGRENALRIGPALVYALVGLRLVALSRHDDIGEYRNVGDIGYAKSNHLALVVATADVLGPVERNRDDAVDVVEEMMLCQIASIKRTEETTKLRLVAIFKVVQQIGIRRALLVEEKTRSTVDEHLTRK